MRKKFWVSQSFNINEDKRSGHIRIKKKKQQAYPVAANIAMQTWHFHHVIH